MEKKPYVEPEVTEVDLDFSEVMTASGCLAATEILQEESGLCLEE